MINIPEINPLQLRKFNCLEDSEIKNSFIPNSHDNNKSCKNFSIIILKYRSRGVSCYQYEQCILFSHTFKI